MYVLSSSITVADAGTKVSSVHFMASLKVFGGRQGTEEAALKRRLGQPEPNGHHSAPTMLLTFGDSWCTCINYPGRVKR